LQASQADARFIAPGLNLPVANPDPLGKLASPAAAMEISRWRSFETGLGCHCTQVVIEFQVVAVGSAQHRGWEQQQNKNYSRHLNQRPTFDGFSGRKRRCYYEQPYIGVLDAGDFMKMSGFITSTLILFSLCAGATAMAQSEKMYSWTDENGVVHYSDTRPEGQQVHEQDIPRDDQRASSNPYKQPETEPSVAQQRRDEIARKNASLALSSGLWSSWKSEVERLEPNRRVFFTNEDGETERMDDVERTDRVAQLKNQIALHCN
jgi:hypothetical protein